MPSDTNPPVLPGYDYSGSAELFAVQRLGRKRNLFYRRFDTTAEAVQFAIETMPEGSSNLVLETESGRLDAVGIQSLYAADGFPLDRHTPGAL